MPQEGNAKKIDKNPLLLLMQFVKFETACGIALFILLETSMRILLPFRIVSFMMEKPALIIATVKRKAEKC